MEPLSRNSATGGFPTNYLRHDNDPTLKESHATEFMLLLQALSYAVGAVVPNRGAHIKDQLGPIIVDQPLGLMGLHTLESVVIQAFVLKSC